MDRRAVSLYKLSILHILFIMIIRLLNFYFRIFTNVPPHIYVNNGKYRTMNKKYTLTLLGLLLSFLSFATIGGPGAGCAGGTYTLTDSTGTGGGVWSSAAPAIATIGAGTGILTALSPGTVVISYTVGSIVDTRVFTVSATPAAITGGPTTFCVGSTATFACATTGGTWAGTGGFSITSAGVATGTSGGVTQVLYYSGPSCYSSLTVTVSATPSPDSVYGPSTICTGSTATFTNTTPGGTWSTSNPAVATISSTGVATGISTGAVFITYTVTGICGPVYEVRIASVISSVSAGTITGAATVLEGTSTTLTSSVSGGTWSSSNTAVATVSAGGSVAGIAPGTCTINYTMGCSSALSALHSITVTPINGISGNVLFASPHSGAVKVWLVKYNSATHMLTAADSLTVTGGSSIHYQFTGLATDSFRVKAAPIDTFTTLSGYMPTYHTASAYWGTASVIYHTSGTADYGKNINMIAGIGTTGPGFIAGDVTTGANKGTAGTIPAVNMLMYLQNSATGAIMQRTYTNSLGHYSFSSLPVGVSYTIYPELINYATTPYTSISLTSASPSMTAATFEQHTLSHTITPIMTAVANVAGTSASFATFPNPSAGRVNVSWDAAAAEQGKVMVTDITGREVHTSAIDMKQGAGTATLDLTGLKNGLYMISVRSASVNYNNKIQIQK